MSDEQWITREEVGIEVNSVKELINHNHNKIKDENTKLLIAIESLGGKIDAIHKRIDKIDEGAKDLPKLNTKLAVMANKVNVISVVLGAISLSILGAYMKLK